MTGRSCLKTILVTQEKNVNILWRREIIFHTDDLDAKRLWSGILQEKNEQVYDYLVLYTNFLFAREIRGRTHTKAVLCTLFFLVLCTLNKNVCNQHTVL